MNINMVDRIDVEWVGKFWNRRPVLTIYPSNVFGTAEAPQVIDLIDNGSVVTLTGSSGGKLAFITEAAKAGVK